MLRVARALMLVALLLWIGAPAALATHVVYVVLTSGTTYTIPANYASLVSIETWGGGASGNCGTTNSFGGGAAAGASYAKITSASGLSAGLTVGIAVGAGGVACSGSGGAGQTGGDTYFCNLNSSCASIAGGAVVVGAKGGPAGSGSTGGTGTCTGCVGATKEAGGNGGGNQAAGGGGAGGPNGVGGNGGTTSGPQGGSGGGGNGGGSNGSSASGNAGVNGGNNFGGTGAGIGCSTSGCTGGAGANGGGGGGAGFTVSVAPGNGGAGGPGIDGADSAHGGGGGGGAADAPSAGVGNGIGGAGGLYGGGGAGGASSATGPGLGGVGAQGAIIFAYNATTTTRSTIPSVMGWIERALIRSAEAQTRNPAPQLVIDGSGNVINIIMADPNFDAPAPGTSFAVPSYVSIANPNAATVGFLPVILSPVEPGWTCPTALSCAPSAQAVP